MSPKSPVSLTPFACLLRVAAALATALSSLALSGCLAGPGTALGGPIGVAPDPKAAELLAEPDSTRGDSFVLFSNRRDLLDATRVQLNAAARAYARLLGERPAATDVRLTSDRTATTVTVRVGRRTIPPFRVSLDPSVRGGRTAEPTRVSLTVVQVVANEWLTAFTGVAANAAPAANSWSQDARLPLWMRMGVLEAVAESPVHEIWLAQLGRTRESIPALTTLLAGAGCDAECQQLLTVPTGEVTLANRVALLLESSRQNASTIPDGRQRFVASAYALTLFFSRREGAPFVKSVIGSALAGRPVESSFSGATTFSSSVSDIDRQWRVWLATFAYAPGT